MRNSQTPDLRKVTIINPEVQYGMLKYMGTLILMIFVSQILAIWLFFNQMTDLIATYPDLAALPPLELLSRYRYMLIAYQSIPILSVSLVGLYFFNKFTLRVAGPIFNIHRTIQNYRRGDIKEVNIRLRKDDYFQDFAQDLNSVFEKENSRSSNH